MQLATWEAIGLLLAVASLGFNLFQLYKERVVRAAHANERRAIEGTLTALWQALHEGSSLLGNLEHKGADARTIRSSAQALLGSQLAHVAQTLEKHFGATLPGVSASPDETDAEGEESTSLIDGVEAVTEFMVDAVERAEKYIFVVGGRSRNDKYLKALKSRVDRGDVRYMRVLTGDHIRHPLCTHLHDLWGSVELGYLPEDKYGGILVTDDTVILALQSSRVGALDKGLRVVGTAIAADYRVHVLDLLTSAATGTVPNLAFVRSLCKSCRSQEEPPGTAGPA